MVDLLPSLLNSLATFHSKNGPHERNHGGKQRTTNLISLMLLCIIHCNVPLSRWSILNGGGQTPAPKKIRFDSCDELHMFHKGKYLLILVGFPTFVGHLSIRLL